MAAVGDTVRLTAAFTTFAGLPFSPDDVKLKIYDGRRQVVLEEDLTPVSEGNYQYDYTIDASPPGPLYFEFSGLLEGSPIASRQELERSWT